MNTRGRPESGGRGARWWLVVLGLIALTAAALEWRTQARPVSPESFTPATPAVVSAAARRETRPTLGPALFVGKARIAHGLAREIPDVLDQLYCYCECDKHAGHKSLLSCYTDGHAAT